MKIIEKVKITLKRILNSIFKVTNVEKLIAQKEAMERLYDESEDQLLELKGSLEVKQNELKNKKNKLDRLNVTNANLLKSGKEDRLKEGYNHKKQLEHEISLLTDSVKSYKTLIQNLTHQLSSYKVKIDKLRNNIDELKAKAEFSQSVDKFKTTMRNLDCENINDISNEIDKDYYKSEYALENIVKSDADVDSFIAEDDADFEKYKKSLEKKSKKKEK